MEDVIELARSFLDRRTAVAILSTANAKGQPEADLELWPDDLIVIPTEAVTNPVEPGGALATARPRMVLIDGEIAFEA